MVDDIKPAAPPTEPAVSGNAPASLPSASAARPDTALPEPLEDATGSAGNAPASEPLKTPKQSWFRTHKKLAVISSVALVLVIGGGAAAALKLRQKPAPKPVAKTKPAAKPQPAPAPPPPLIVSPLTGSPVSEADSKRPVTAIMIENSPDARPQSGLLDAGVVFEAIAEGGITRFLTLFQEGKPGYIGPVRSVRPYYVDWLIPFDAPVAHVGGSKDALDMLKALHWKDLDQFFNPAPYHRITSRYAPHNVYTSMAELDALNASKGYTSSTFSGFPRKPDNLSKTPAAAQIDFNISGPLYNVHYDYDVTNGTYKRSEGGKPHVDEKSGVQLAPRVVVAIVVPFRSIKASDGFREQYDDIGGGPAFVFEDGNVLQVNWAKKDQASQIVFTGANGAPVNFNTGQTWITAVGAASDVTYK